MQKLHIKSLEEMAIAVYNQSKQIGSMADSLLTMIKDETAYVTKTASGFNREAVREVQDLAADIQQNRSSSKDYYRIPRQTKTPFVSNVYLSAATKALCITVAVPLMEGDTLKGVLCADVDLQYLSSLPC